jgi:LEA14-like dessication related protein
LKKPILWILGGAAALYFLARYSFSRKANFILQSVKPGGTLLQPRILISLAVQNPTNQEITIKSIVGSVYVDDNFLASVSSFGDQRITGNSESTLQLTARPSAIGIFQTLKRLVTQPIPGTQIRFTGTANVDGINVPIEQSNIL